MTDLANKFKNKSKLKIKTKNPNTNGNLGEIQNPRLSVHLSQKEKFNLQWKN